MTKLRRLGATLSVGLVVSLAACGDGDDGTDGRGADGADRPVVVVTTNILGDVVSEVAGELVEVVTVMPVGANPHDFQASARQAAAMRDADLLVVNGGGFEHGLDDVIAGAESDGVPVFEALSAVDALDLGGDAGGGVDPHFFTDPRRMAAAVEGVVDALNRDVDGVDVDTLRDSADRYLSELDRLDAAIESTLSDIAGTDRVLVTNHEVFGYFADRYRFEVVGTVVPGGSTDEGASAGELSGLVDVIVELGVPAIFADTSAPGGLARTLAEEVGAVEVVELYSESLGEEGSDGSTYLDMMRTNAERIAAALR